MTDFYLFVILFAVGLGLQALGLGLQARGLRKHRSECLRTRGRRHWRSPAWLLWAMGVAVILFVGVRDRDLVLVGGQAMGAVVLHKWLFRL